LQAGSTRHVDHNKLAALDFHRSHFVVAQQIGADLVPVVQLAPQHGAQLLDKTTPPPSKAPVAAPPAVTTAKPPLAKDKSSLAGPRTQSIKIVLIRWGFLKNHQLQASKNQ